MFVGVARLTLQIPESGSLKAKRQVLRRVTDRLKARFNVAVAEVDDQDLWQKATLGLSVVGNDRRHVDEQMEKVIHFVEEMYVAPLLSRQTEIMGFGDTLYTPPRSTSAARDEEDEEAGDLEGDEDEAGPEADLEELIAGMGRGDRSMAEAEGMVDWARRPGKRESGLTSVAPERRGSLSDDDIRARARSLRNPREWEKK
ncbi:DUF503 domain-containing protein [Cystobacter ferrugineus]|uniref:DUF503 domain-containing protein n=1 Tax=Cystobacter ferrugineus TaxID=83449 RepID=A0A1L9AXI0_9BACT|nr:DUF503 domain-containing protein [Cystobacter ferrugineus]OJH34709.1 hypothetical protein BON30_41870 [Cystobacter ferrugineus]